MVLTKPSANADIRLSFFVRFPSSSRKIFVALHVLSDFSVCMCPPTIMVHATPRKKNVSHTTLYITCPYGWSIRHYSLWCCGQKETLEEPCKSLTK